MRVKGPGPVPLEIWEPREEGDLEPCEKPQCIKECVDWYYWKAPYLKLEGLTKDQDDQLRKEVKAATEKALKAAEGITVATLVVSRDGKIQTREKSKPPRLESLTVGMLSGTIQMGLPDGTNKSHRPTNAGRRREVS